MRLHFRNLPEITKEKLLPEQGTHLHEVHIWSHLIHSDDPFLNEATHVLSTEESDRALRYHFEKDRKIYESGHVFIRKILAHYTDQNPAELSLSPIVNQKPKLENSPFQVNFNISHSGNRILVALGFDTEVGIDVEKIVPDFDTDGFAEANYHPNELAHFRSLKDNDVNDYFYNIWTRKEAWLKLTGEGINDKLKELDFSGNEIMYELHSKHKNLFMTSWKEAVDYIATFAAFDDKKKLLFFGSDLLTPLEY